jgi:acyl-coenzyme A synthetase/AMP-(fatty) acid ligase
LRSSKTPSAVQPVEALPFKDNGKLVRRTLREQLTVGTHV